VTGPHPPWLAMTLLTGIIHADDRDALLGDLFEEHALRASASPTSAARWYWNQTIHSMPILLGRRARRSRWMSTLAIAIGAYLVVGALNAVGTSALEWWLVGFASPNRITSALVGLLAISAGAHLASRVRSTAGKVVGGLVMVVAVVMLLFPLDASPVWYQLTFLILGPLAAHLGSAAATPTRGQRS
jgi:drug/metabolite transporter (DMT)-like permease